MNGFKTAMEILELLKTRPPENYQEQEIMWLVNHS